jgi:hypothetical protein
MLSVPVIDDDYLVSSSLSLTFAFIEIDEKGRKVYASLICRSLFSELMAAYFVERKLINYPVSLGNYL